MAASKTHGGAGRADENFQHGYRLVCEHPLFGGLLNAASIIRQEQNRCPKKGFAVVGKNGHIHVHPRRLALPAEWAYVLAHCVLHLGFNHFQHKDRPREWNAACDCIVAKFLADLKFGLPPDGSHFPANYRTRDEESLYRDFCEHGIPTGMSNWGTADDHADMIIMDDTPRYFYGSGRKWEDIFAGGLVDAVTRSVDIAAGVEESFRSDSRARRSDAERARQWFISSFPLLGALATGFRIIDDAGVCNRNDIRVAAVNDELREIFINPQAGLDPDELRFVMAHELLHVGLRHIPRREGRDPYLWNVACDYVVNGWLVEMGIGSPPKIGLLYDPALKSESAESLYDRIVKDARTYRRLATLRGNALGDMLEGEREWWRTGDGVTLDEFFRRCLREGLSFHQTMSRGLLPGSLVEEIYALSQPPIPWDVQLARWFDTYFPPLHRSRTYQRLSRRQSSTPEIPRPQWYSPPVPEKSRTFGVILDTSGSMDRVVLAKALGAIASYSMARDVHAVRVLFCDAVVFDEGYMAPEDIAGRVRVKGRGGTVLQPAVDLLDRTQDFPPAAPVLLITDGLCDHVRILKRDHAFLLPRGMRLPFGTDAPVFFME